MATKQFKPLTLDSQIIRVCDRVVEVLLYLLFLLIPVFFIILTRDQFELPKLTVFRSLTSLMLGAWGIRILAARRFDFRKTSLDLPILIWSGLQVLTTIFSVSTPVSILGEYENFRGLITVLNYVLLYYLVVNFIRTRSQINRLLIVVFLSGLLVTAYGVAQFFSMDFIAWNPASIAPGRYFSSLGNPNFLAAFLAMVMPWIVIFFIETRSLFRRILLYTSFIIMFTALMGTWSRGGSLGLLAAFAILLGFGAIRAWRHLQNQAAAAHFSMGALFAHWLSKYRLMAITLGFSIMLLITISSTYGHHHIMRMVDTVLHFKSAIQTSRLHIWGPALGMIHDFPILGTGLDTFKTVFPRYATAAFAAIDGANVSSRTAHNEVLQVLATQGVVGLLIVTWLTVMILLNWWKAYRSTQDRWQDRLLLVGMLATWAAYSVQNLFSFGVVAIDSLYWLVIGFIPLLQVTPEEQTALAPALTPTPTPSQFWNRLGQLRYGLMLIAGVAGLWLAIQAYNIALADYSYNLGTVYRLRGMLEYSEQAFAKSAQLVPLEVKYVVYQGLAYEEKAKNAPREKQIALVQQAITAYKHGVEMNPTNAYYLGNVGRAFTMAASLEPGIQTYYDQAVYYFKAAVRYAPVTVLFYQNLALLYFEHKDLKNFYQVAETLGNFDKLEGARLLFTAGNQAYNAEQLELAKECYEKSLQIDATYVEAYFNLGVTFARFGKPEASIKLWKKALEIKPDFTPAQQMLERYKSSSAQPASQSIFNH